MGILSQCVVFQYLALFRAIWVAVSSNSASNSAQNRLSEVVDSIIKYNYTIVYIIAEKCACLVLMVAFTRVFEKVQLRTHLP